MWIEFSGDGEPGSADGAGRGKAGWLLVSAPDGEAFMAFRFLIAVAGGIGTGGKAGLIRVPGEPLPSVTLTDSDRAPYTARLAEMRTTARNRDRLAETAEKFREPGGAAPVIVPPSDRMRPEDIKAVDFLHDSA